MLVAQVLACTHLVAWRRDDAAHARDLERLRGELGASPKPLRGTPGDDIVVIVLDTVRADHLGVYGYPHGTTPNLDAWASGARVWEQMTAVSSWTLPSHASLFTGLWPREHAARGLPDRMAAPLHEGADTVARRLRTAGWFTAGIAANQAFLDRSWGLDQGFALWFCAQFSRDDRRTPYPTADRVTDAALHVLEHRPAAPLFLFVNYMDAHSPWIPREGYVRNPERVYRDILPGGSRFDARKVATIVDHELDEETRLAWVEAYDAELRFLDEHLGRLLAALDEVEHVFVTSDHGEYLGEHFLVEHGKDLYETVLDVPLIVRGSGVGRTHEPVQHPDVARMMLAAAGLGRIGTTSELQVAELYYTRKREQDPRYGGRFHRIRRAFTLGKRSLLVGSDGTVEAYDLATDPGQLRPVTPWPELRAAADAWLVAHPETPPAGASGMETEALRALGYL